MSECFKREYISFTIRLAKRMTPLMLFIVSCQRPDCKNTNPIFDRFSPNAKEYKNELVKQLEKVDQSKVTYWLSNYEKRDDADYIVVNVKSEGLCADIVLRIGSSKNGIEGILENKGKGYIGAELKNLKFDIKKDTLNTEFIFKGINGIAD